MRGTKAKSMRRYVEGRYPFLSPTPLYMGAGQRRTTAVLSETCQRSVYQHLKKAYKKAKSN